jgi:hypothetical protein
MRMPLRRLFRIALSGSMAVLGCSLILAAPARAAAPIEKALPGSTFLLLKVNNAAAFRDSFNRSQIGQLWNDPAMKPLRDDFVSKLEDTNKSLQNAVGLTVLDLVELPQGPVALALIGRDDPKIPFAGLVSVDAGSKAQVLNDAMVKFTKLSEEKGECKATTETFNDLTIHIIHSMKEEDKDDPPVVWTKQGGVFLIATDVDAVKDLVTHADGRDGSLADNESFMTVNRKVGDDAPALFYVDVTQGIKTFARAAGGQGGNAQQIDALLQVTGINGLKALGGNFMFNAGSFEMQTKLFVLAPAPTQGVLKLFSMPAVNLRPEPWVPASAVTYESISWDLDNAYNALNELANMLQPGLLQNLQTQLPGPTGGEPIDFQKDLFGPLGDRISIISDYKKKPTDKDDEDNQRTLIGIALEDPKAFQTTLNRLLVMLKPTYKKREFQGTTIYDIELPDMPNGGGGKVAAQGAISLAVAKETCFLSIEPTLLEQVLRAGGPRLADSADFLSIAKELPNQTSTLSYARAEESARQLYEMIKSGQFQKAFEQAAMAGGPDVPKVGELINKDKLPEFSVFSKYLSSSGGYGIMTDEGFYSVTFSSRKVNP